MPLGAPKHVPNEQSQELVRALVVAGWTHEKIASAVRVDEKTLRKHYANELDHAKAMADAMVSRSLLMQAVGGPRQEWERANVSAAIWYSKTQMGWKQPDAEVKFTQEGGSIVFKIGREFDGV